MKSSIGLRLNQKTHRVISIAISILLLGIALVADGHAQSRRGRSRTRVTRAHAQQALMHSSSQRSGAAKIPAGYRPAHLRLMAEEAEIVGEEIVNQGLISDGYVEGAPMDEGVIIDNGTPVEEFGEWDNAWDDDAVYEDGYADEYYDECGCGACGGGGGGIGGAINTFGFNLQDASIFAGVNAFRGPSNLGSTGSFGFHEGFNIGIPLSLAVNQ